MKKLDFYNVENRPWTSPRLYYGAIVGHTTTSSAKIWVRSRYEGKYHFILTNTELLDKDIDNIGNDPALEFIASLGDKVVYNNLQEFKDSTDRTHVFNIDFLRSETQYFYYVLSDDISIENRMIIGYQTIHSFKTISEDKSYLTFGLYSCHDPFNKESGAVTWKHLFEVLEEKKADFVIGGGDQVYVDSTKTDIWKWLKKIKNDLLKKNKAEIKQVMLSWYQDVYRGYWGFPNVKQVHRSIPNYMIWDDHEIMDGWGSRTRAELSDELDTWYEWEDKKKNLMLADGMFEAAKTVYNQYQHCHNPTTEKGVFDFSLIQKHAAFYFFDMRGQREYDLNRLSRRDGAGAKDRILGKNQLARFSSWLKNISSDAKVIYVVSPVPVIHWTGFAVNTGDIFGAKDDFRDEWDHESNHLERDKFLHQLFEYSNQTGTPIAFLSGDVHMSAVFRMTNNKYRRAKVFQVTSSPITRPPAPAIADVILSNTGSIKTKNKESGFRYERLKKFRTRSFCLLCSQISDKNELSLYVEFHGESTDEDEMRNKRIKLI